MLLFIFCGNIRISRENATTTETVGPPNGKNFPYDIDTGTAPTLAIFTAGTLQTVTFQPRLTTDLTTIEKP